MKKFILSIIIILFTNIDSFSHINHYKNYNYLEYELFRNNKPIGYHKYKFTKNGENLLVNSEVNFKITKLGIDLYQYSAKSEENYINGIFSGFKSKTNQNKKAKYVNIKIDPTSKNLIVDGSSYKGIADKEMIIGTWWNHEIVKKNAQISAVSGRINDKIYKTLKFNFSSSDPSLSKDKKLNTDIWYEEETYLWVKAAFDKTGYWEYRIKTYK